MSIESKAWGVENATSALAPMTVTRRDLRDDDVAIAIAYCGVCHSDAHTAHNDWGGTRYPCVPGHEIVGRVTALGSAVSDFKVGDWVAVGCMVDSCTSCVACDAGEEQHCVKGATYTYDGKDRVTGEITKGGYTDHIVVRDRFVLRVPDGLDKRRAAPILCAGITLWSPLQRFDAGPGKRVAIAGLGGLGHMGVKLAAALGAHVTVITTSPSKAAEASKLGANEVLLSTDAAAMKAAASSFDLLIDTIPKAHDVSPYLQLLGRNGALVVVGAIEPLPSLHSGLLLRNNRSLTGSAIGGIAATQELLDFCAEKGVLPDCEFVPMAEINGAWARMMAGDVKYRFVVEMDGAAG